MAIIGPVFIPGSESPTTKGTLEMSKDLKQLIRDLPPAWKAMPTRGGHMKLRHESGAIVTCASTPSDWRAIRNLRARIKRVSR